MIKRQNRLMRKEYTVKKCSEPILIDADWDKPDWQGIESVEISLPHWLTQPEHFPYTEVKLQYDAENIYMLFFECMTALCELLLRISTARFGRIVASNSFLLRILIIPMLISTWKLIAVEFF